MILLDTCFASPSLRDAVEAARSLESVESASAVPEVGALIGGIYRVLGPLGRGAMGVVLIARDETLDRKVAIKFVRSELLDDGFRERFMSEARAMARVSHPNTLQIHAFGTHQGAPYFVMELVEGVTLDQWIARSGGPPPLDEALRVMGQICDGVAAIHAANTVHRDLKPSNILIDANMQARVADLGLAILRRQDGPTKREIVGTPAYMAPEVAFPTDADEGFGPLADVYSLGCVAYEVLTGRPPFQADGHMQMVYRHATASVTPPSALRSHLPASVDEAILHALAKRPAERTPTAAALAAALRAAAKGADEPARILVAEDHDDFRGALALALEVEFPNAELECVADGLAALRAFDRKRPSVAILDLRMPEMDGTELARQLRERDREATMPILMLTASGGPAEWRQLSAMGVDGFLVKPVALDDVVALVRRSLQKRASSPGRGRVSA